MLEVISKNTLDKKFLERCIIIIIKSEFRGASCPYACHMRDEGSSLFVC